MEIHPNPGFSDVSNRVPILRGELINEDGTIEDDITKYQKILEEISNQFPKTILSEGDVVLTVSGTIGKIAYITHNHKGWQISSNLIRLSPSKSKLYSKFFFRYFRDFFTSYKRSSAVIPV